MACLDLHASRFVFRPPLGFIASGGNKGSRSGTGPSTGNPDMKDVLLGLLFIGIIIGAIVAAAHLCLLPQRLFLRDERWLTKKEFREVNPGKAWCRHVPAIALVAGFLLHVTSFLIVHATSTSGATLMVGFLPLAFLWIYVPVGVVEMTVGVSVLVPVGRGRGGDARFIAVPGAVKAGVCRLGLTALVFAAFLTAAYW